MICGVMRLYELSLLYYQMARNSAGNRNLAREQELIIEIIPLNDYKLIKS